MGVIEISVDVVTFLLLVVAMGIGLGNGKTNASAEATGIWLSFVQQQLGMEIDDSERGRRNPESAASNRKEIGLWSLAGRHNDDDLPSRILQQKSYVASTKCDLARSLPCTTTGCIIMY
ncbi:hypothetical protein PI124_g12903 [Phytophthora idaei]|nr:hypothetical protein PI125_g12553 [Phytophthora idaei]KAG3150467.1 hypothetical protein PI126_g11498 [Phytophthora idaei]KAG3242244.1 hypothetical protein PI124_g12903 [Phytophthora idaei]